MGSSTISVQLFSVVATSVSFPPPVIAIATVQHQLPLFNFQFDRHAEVDHRKREHSERFSCLLSYIEQVSVQLARTNELEHLVCWDTTEGDSQGSGDRAPSSSRRTVLLEKPASKQLAPGGARLRRGAAPAATEAEGFVVKESQGRDSSRTVKTKPGEGGLGLLHLVLAMALLGLALVTVLVVFHSSASPPVEATSQGKEVTYGSVIKLKHERTKYRLHSHEVPYGSGSGQQSVTAFPGVEDGNSHWIVRPASDDEHEDDHEQGDVVPNGSVIRLQHVRTRKWLHSHLHQSPISGNLEVSAFGGDEQTDTGDYWRLEIEGKGNVWMQDQKVRLRHVDTNGYLHSHDKKYSRIVQGQQEVCGVLKKNADNLWTAAEGIYFLPKGSKVV